MPAQPSGAIKRAKRPARVPGEEYIRQREGTAVWQIAFIIDGRRFRESAGTEDREQAAALALRRWNEEYQRIKLGIRPAEHLSLQTAFIRYYDEVARHTSYGEGGQKYQMNVMRALLGGNVALSEIDDRFVSGFVRDLRAHRIASDQAEYSPATLNRYLTTLHVVCKRAREVWGVEVGDWNLRKHLLDEPEGREVFLDHAQARKLLEAACGHLQAVLLLALMTGMRKSNVLGLQWPNISMDMGRAVLIQKGNRRLSVELTEPALKLLDRLEPDATKRQGPVFWFGNPAVDCACVHCQAPTFRGTPITSIKRSFATAVRTAGLADLPNGRMRFHDLRHTFASWLLAECGDLRLVQDALGHRQITTTARYSHLMPGRKRAAIAGAVAGLLEAPVVDVADDDVREVG